MIAVADPLLAQTIPGASPPTSEKDVPAGTNHAAPTVPPRLSVAEVNPSAIIRPVDAPDYEELAKRFRPIFAHITSTALDREKSRTLAFGAVAELRAAGFHRLRIPVSHGGLGATLPQFFRLLVELAEADSNVSHLFRGHFAFLEGRLNLADPAAQEQWFRRVVEGAIIGYAMAERTENTGGSCQLLQEGNEWFVHGTKYYSTGTIYADWIVATVLEGEDRVSVAVPVEAPGVTRVDDWDGFGQRLTGSGTTRFERVALPPENIIRRFSATELHTYSYQTSFLQLVLLASMVGTGRAALREGTALVQGRTRAFHVPGVSSPRHDPLIQRVVGKVASLVFASETLVEGIAGHLEHLYQSAVTGKADEALYVSTEIKAFQAQQVVIQQVLEANTLIFEAGGASFTSTARALDRHWRNARTAASHNPAVHREQVIGNYLVNGITPETARREALEKAKAAKAAAATKQPAGPNEATSSALSSAAKPGPGPTTAQSSAAA